MGNGRNQNQAQRGKASRGRRIMGSIRTNETNTIIPTQGNGIQPIKGQSMDGNSGMGDGQEAYDCKRDGIDSYHLALRMISLRIGSRRFETLPEMYWQERHGVIP
jgi:hypothetical protein